MTDRPTAFGIDGLYDPVEIGRGGMGVVYRVEQPTLRRTLALKILVPGANGGATARILREGAALGGLTGHPNVVPVISVGVTDSGAPYLLMPYFSAGSIADTLRTHGPLPADAVLRVGIAIAGALAAAHAAGVLHRDVKPANILLSDYGEPMIADFGISRIVDGYQTTGAQVSATFAHAAPEIIEGRPPTESADVYALGSTLFEMLSGSPPFPTHEDEAIVALFLRIARDPPPDLRSRGAPGPLCDVVEAALAKDPARRPSSMAAFGRHLQEVERRLRMGPTPMHGLDPILRDSGTEARVQQPSGPMPTTAEEAPATARGGRRAAGAVGATAVCIVLAIVAAFVLTRVRDRGDSTLAPATPRSLRPGSPTAAAAPTRATAPSSTAPAFVDEPGALGTSLPGSSREDPLPLNEPALIGPTSSRWRVTVGFVQADFTAEALAPDARNAAPASGNRYVGVHVQFDYLGPEERAPVRMVELRAFTSSRGPIDRAVPGVAPPSDCWVDETVERGASKQCVMPFEVADGEVGSLLLRSTQPEIWFTAHE